MGAKKKIVVRGGPPRPTIFEQRIEAHLRRRLEASPYTVPTEVIDLIVKDPGRNEAVSMAPRADAPNALPAANGAPDRLAGLRCRIDHSDLVERRMRDAGLDIDSLTGERSLDGIAIPTGRDQIRLAVVHRWRPFLGATCEPARVLVGDAAYDADHLGDELLHLTLDVSLAALIDLLDDLEQLDPALLRAAWERDVPNLERLLARHHNRLPTFAGLSHVSDGLERIYTALTTFWEYERGFEMLGASGGDERVTHSTLGTALAGTTALTACFGGGRRDATYIVDSWLHVLHIQELIAMGAGHHVLAHPYRSYGPDGNPADVDHVIGLGSTEGHAALARSFGQVSPFTHDPRLKQVEEEAPAHFVHGWEPASLAIAIPLMIAHGLPNRAGRPKGARTADDPQAHAGPRVYKSAFGRLAFLVLSNICTATTADVLAYGDRALDLETGGPVALSALVHNPKAWERLYGARGDYSPIAAASLGLGEYIFESEIDRVRRSLHSFIPADADKHALGFHPSAWRSAGDGLRLREAHRNVPAGYRRALPGCYRVLPQAVMDFCFAEAAAIAPGHTPFAQDPAIRLAATGKLVVMPFGTLGMMPDVDTSVVPLGNGATGIATGMGELNHAVDRVVAMARLGETPALAPPSAAKLRKRRARKASRHARKHRH